METSSRNHRLHGALFGLVLSFFLALASASQAQVGDVYFDVSVRGSGSATVHARVYNNPSLKKGATILAVHGLTETGFTYQPLANVIFEDSRLRQRIRRVVALDFVGHGESSVPSNLPDGVRFGDLTIEDEVSTLLQSITALRANGLGANVLIAHSLGGLVVQSAQETLLANGSNLAKVGFGLAILLAPVPCADSPFNFTPGGDLSPFIVNDEVLGSHLDLPPSIWPLAGGFTTLSGSIVANAPTAEVVAANEYSGIEPLTTLLQVTDTIPLPRPSVRRGAFAPRNGTLLAVVSFSQDVLVPATDLDDLYAYLIGRTGLLYRPVVGADAVHSMHISNPRGLVSTLREML